MKYFLLECFFLVLGTSYALGEESNIILAKGDWGGGARSISIDPTATQDENNIYIIVNFVSDLFISVF